MTRRSETFRSPPVQPRGTALALDREDLFRSPRRKEAELEDPLDRDDHCLPRLGGFLHFPVNIKQKSLNRPNGAARLAMPRKSITISRAPRRERVSIFSFAQEVQSQLWRQCEMSLIDGLLFPRFSISIRPFRSRGYE